MNSGSNHQTPNETNLVIGANNSIKREIKPGEKHSYTVSLNAGDFVNIIAEQNGIDLKLSLFNPQKKLLISFDGAEKIFGPEKLRWIAEESGTYLVKVNALEKGLPTSSYAIYLESLRPSNSEDKLYINAQVVSSKADKLLKIGKKDSLEEACSLFKESIILWKSCNDKLLQGATLLSLGTVYFDLNNDKEAVTAYEEALSIIRAIPDKELEGALLNNIAVTKERMGDRKSALELYNQALEIRKSIGDTIGEASVLSSIGGLYNSLGEREKALDFLLKSLELSKTFSNLTNQATVLNNIGLTYSQMRNKEKALLYLTQSLELRYKLNDYRGQVITINNIGGVYRRFSENDKALDFYKQALPIAINLGDKRLEASVLNSIGLVQFAIGNNEIALEVFSKVLAIRKQVNDKSGEAITLNNIGSVNIALGENQKALSVLNKALEIDREQNNYQAVGVDLISLGTVYRRIGQLDKALEAYNQALPIFVKLKDRDREARVLLNLGSAYDIKGEAEIAIDYYNKALFVSKSASIKVVEGAALSNLGLAYDKKGDKDKALHYLNQALEVRKGVGDKLGEATALHNIGIVHLGSGDFVTALNYLNNSLSLAQAAGDQESEANSLYHIARCLIYLEKIDEAKQTIEKVVDYFEKRRATFVDPDIRASYGGVKYDYNLLYIDILMQLHKKSPQEGFDKIALGIYERFKGRILLEMLNEAQANIATDLDKTLVENETLVRKTLLKKNEQLTRLIAKSAKKDEIKALEKEIFDLELRYDGLQTEIKQKSPRYAALTQPVSFDLSEVQKSVLDKETLLLAFSLDAERSYIWAVTHNSLTSYQIPKRSVIEPIADEFYKQITARIPKKYELESETRKRIEKADSEYQISAKKLSDILLKPINNLSDFKRIVIVADGALQQIPFNALPKEKENGEVVPLILDHEVVSLPSISTLLTLRKTSPTKGAPSTELAVFADPVFSKNDERVRNSEPKSPRKEQDTDNPDIALRLTELMRLKTSEGTNIELPRLVFSLQEASSIKKISGNNSRLFINFNANLQSLLNEDLSKYRVIHFATHGLFNMEKPELSGLVLSLYNANGAEQPGILTLQQVYGLKLKSELVVLSACQTGLGKIIRGEGIIGLTRGFMYAGANKVVVTLWAINDQSTSEFMGIFYQGLLGKKLRPSEALRQAQISMIKNKKWNNPFYWAAFQLHGDWR